METSGSSQKLTMSMQSSFLELLAKNRQLNEYWVERKKNYTELKKNLKFYLSKLKHEVYAPIGTKAFMRGNLVHTNDIMVALGCGYFVKVSSAQASEICDRRLKEIEEMLDKISRERELFENTLRIPKEFEAFGDGGRKEIVEPYDEQEEKKWREKHREKVIQHKKKLAEIKKQIKENERKDEEDIMRHLDLLEMQEELQEDIDRLGGESSDEEYDEDEYNSGDDDEEEEDDNEEEEEEEEEDNKPKEKHILPSNLKTKKSPSNLPKKQVRFNFSDKIEETIENSNEEDVPKKQVRFDFSEKTEETLEESLEENINRIKLTAISDTIKETDANKCVTEINPQRPISKFKARKLNH